MKMKTDFHKETNTIIATGESKKGSIYRGKARCMDSDTFDFSTGKKIATNKALISQCETIMKEVNKKEDELFGILLKIASKKRRLIKRIAKLKKENRILGGEKIDEDTDEDN